MSDASAAIAAALDPLLRNDAGVIAAFGAKRVMIFDLPPPASVNAGFPYITTGDGHQVDQQYEGFDSGELTVQLHVWSRPSPRSFAEVKPIAAAAKAAISNLAALALTGFRLVDALPLDTQYLEDPDGLTVHAVVRVTISYDPA